MAERPAEQSTATPTEPAFEVASSDGTSIAVVPRPGREGGGPPLILVHGTLGDHTTFREVGPLFAASRPVYEIDRRGRGASGDRAPYAIEREFEDVAAVVREISARHDGAAVDVVGHSFGGRVGLGAALLADRLRRLVVYEGAPAPPGRSYRPPGLEDRVRTMLAAGDPAGAVRTFLREVVGMSEPELDAYAANPVWPARVAAAPTLLRELDAEASPAASLDRLSAVTQPVLQVLGGDSLPVFAEATDALDRRLADGRAVVIPGAKHAAHHTHPDAFVAQVLAFLDGPPRDGM